MFSRNKNTAKICLNDATNQHLLHVPKRIRGLEAWLTEHRDATYAARSYVLLDKRTRSSNFRRQSRPQLKRSRSQLIRSSPWPRKIAPSLTVHFELDGQDIAADSQTQGNEQQHTNTSDFYMDHRYIDVVYTTSSTFTNLYSLETFQGADGQPFI